MHSVDVIKVPVPAPAQVIKVPVESPAAIVKVLVPGIPGPRGLAGIDGTNGTNGGLPPIIVYQSIPSNEWIFIHSFPYSPSVVIEDSAGTVIITRIEYVSPTEVRSITTSAFSGKATLR